MKPLGQLTTPEVTRTMNHARTSFALADGSRDAEELLPQIYHELRKLASRRLASEHHGLTLQATALVHEAYIRLVENLEGRRWDSIGHFFAAAAEAIRRILIERARRRRSLKRGGGHKRIGLEDVDVTSREPRSDLLALDEALVELEKSNQRAAEVVKLRCFARLTSPEAARALGIATSTADSDWAYARAWLRLKLREGR